MYIYYVIGFFAILLLYTVFTKKWGISTYLISVYLLTLITSLFITGIVKYYTESLNASIVYSTALFLFFQPFIRKAPELKPLSNPKVIKKVATYGQIISWVLIVLMILILPAIIQSYQAGSDSIRSGYYSYHGNFITSFAINIIDILNPLSFSLLTLSFYFYSFVEGYDKIKRLTFIASLSAPYYGIMTGGRTQMFYWLLSLIFNYVLFRKYIPKVSKKQLVKYIYIIVALISLYVIRVTVDRFASSEWGTNDSILVYMGQPYLNFCYFFENYSSTHFSLSRIFPLIDSLFNGALNLQTYREAVYSSSGMDIGVFYTLLGDFLVDIGLNGIYVYAIIYLILANLLLRKKQLGLSEILIIGLLFLIPLQGVFYYSFWKRQVTFCALLVVIFSLTIKPIKPNR